MSGALISLIRAYQRINHAMVGSGFPLTGWSGCRQWPTCSEYAAHAIGEHGTLRGTYRALMRMLHCHPLQFTH